ncbi:hypothetical protein [Catenulispora subtropica]|uniref:Secreted protein n=1 Tax=Catenulispora subtropica TaxID=450798 RepID=A0ABN2RS83_9ACTN
MRLRLLGTVSAAGLLVAGLPALASADTTSGSDGWTPVTYAPRDYAAGDVCSFELKVDFPTQGVEERVAVTNPDGTPLRTDFRGPLIARFTNATTGAHMDGDLSGAGTLYNLPTGWSLWTVPDNIGVTIHAGNPYHAKGEFILSGGSVIAVSPAKQDAILHQTQVTDVCAAVA